MAIDFHTETNIPILRQVGHVQQRQIQHLLRVVAKQSVELDKLRGVDDVDLQQRLAALESEMTKEQEGSAESNSGSDSSSGSSETGPPGSKPERKPQTGHGPTPQLDIEEVRERFLLDDADTVCPSCGKTLALWEGQLETSELIDVIDVTYRLVTVERQKYRCSCGGCVETAPGPERTQDGGRYSLPFSAKVASDKYLDHQPLERQVRAMRRVGLTVTSQTLWDQLWALATLLLPVYEAIRERILAEPVIGLDQTGWPNLASKGAKLWQMWALTSKDAIWHAIRGDKGLESWDELVGSYHGTIVADQLSTHVSGARAGPDISLAACWAHVLRRYRDALSDFPQARVMLDLIRELYDVEEKAGAMVTAALEKDPSRSREEVDAEIRKRLRTEESADIIKRMWAWMSTVRVLGSTSLGKAIKYTINHAVQLKLFLNDPLIWLDNNRTERALRGPVVGRRNHFGSKSQRGTEVAAVFYSIFETAKLLGINPTEYVVEAATRAKRGDATPLLPWDYAAAETTKDAQEAT